MYLHNAFHLEMESGTELLVEPRLYLSIKYELHTETKQSAKRNLRVVKHQSILFNILLGNGFNRFSLFPAVSWFFFSLPCSVVVAASKSLMLKHLHGKKQKRNERRGEAEGRGVAVLSTSTEFIQ